MLIHDICSNKQYTFASICHFWYLRSVASIVHGTTSSGIYAPIGKVYTSCELLMPLGVSSSPLENKEAKLQLELKTEQLDESKEWYSIKRWSKENGVNWRNISWRKMKVISYELGYEVKKIFDANYGQVNIYNVNVFKAYFNKCE